MEAGREEAQVLDLDHVAGGVCTGLSRWACLVGS